MGQRRYPGATPFTKDQAKIFYGRNNDIRNLLTMVRVEQKVLLYSKSGLGKTSLLEAGVIPKLPKNYVPVSIRFYAKRKDSLSPVEGVLNALENTLGKMDDMPSGALDELETTQKTRKTLWYYFKKLQLSQPPEPETPEIDDDEEKDEEEITRHLPKTFVLVFDQFEELFSYSKAEIDEFKQQFYELTEQNVPERYAELIAPARRKNREKFNRKVLSEIHRKTNVKTVFAIRSDRLSLLNQLSDKITDIQQIFYEIRPLTNDQAKEAIVNPAKDNSEGFETQPYNFHQDAINKIIHELTKKETGSENIETTQLQIVCHRIEDIAESKRKENPDNGQVEIQVSDLPNFKNIFLDFYEDSIRKLQKESRDKAKRMIEDELIRSKQRISLDENICKEFLTGEELKTLVDTHLLRAERNSFGRFSFELSHDTLVEPILESKNKYEQEKRLRELEAKKEEERIEREKEVKRMQEVQRRKTRWQRTIIGIVSLFLVVSLALGYWGFLNFCATAKESIKTMNKEREATLLLIRFKDTTYQEFMNKGDTAVENDKYEEARGYYQEAIKNIHAIVAGQELDTNTSCNIRELFTNSLKNEITENTAIYLKETRPKAIDDSIKRLQYVNSKIKNSLALAAKDSLMRALYARAQKFINEKDYVSALEVYKEAYLEEAKQQTTIKLFNKTKNDGIGFYTRIMNRAAQLDPGEVKRAKLLLEKIKSSKL
jgi:hypothetical protein